MKVKFQNPCPSGTLEGSSLLNRSKVKISTENGHDVVSPYDGKVTKITSDSVTIIHHVSDKKWISDIDGFRPDVTLNQHVFKNKRIGQSKNGNLKFEVSPNVNLTDLITIGIDSTKTQNDTEPPKDSERTNDPIDDALKVFLSPISFIRGALNLNKKGLDEQEIQEKTTLIKEEISRMKKLF